MFDVEDVVDFEPIRLALQLVDAREMLATIAKSYPAEVWDRKRDRCTVCNTDDRVMCDDAFECLAQDVGDLVFVRIGADRHDAAALVGYWLREHEYGDWTSWTDNLAEMFFQEYRHAQWKKEYEDAFGFGESDMPKEWW